MVHPTVTARQLRIGTRRLTLIVVFFLQLSAPVQAQDPNRVRMAYSAFSISFLNLFVARDAGLFKKHGIEIELIQMAGPLPVAALAAPMLASPAVAGTASDLTSIRALSGA